MLCSFALQAAIRPGEIETVSGLLQAAEQLASGAGLGSLVRPLALVLGLSVAVALGFVVTAAGICLAFVPPKGSGGTLLYEVKIWLACVCFVALAALLFRRRAGAREDFAATDSV